MLQPWGRAFQYSSYKGAYRTYAVGSGQVMYKWIGISMLCSRLSCTTFYLFIFISQESFDRWLWVSKVSHKRLVGYNKLFGQIHLRTKQTELEYVLQITWQSSFLTLLVKPLLQCKLLPLISFEYALDEVDIKSVVILPFDEGTAFEDGLNGSDIRTACFSDMAVKIMW